MKKDVTELKKMFVEILQNPALAGQAAQFTKDSLVSDFPVIGQDLVNTFGSQPQIINANNYQSNNYQPVVLNETEIHQHEEVEESLSLVDMERNLIIKAIKKHKGKRKDASIDLGISERTLYRKLKDYNLEEL